MDDLGGYHYFWKHPNISEMFIPEQLRKHHQKNNL